MINRILMELYDDYEKGNIDSLLEFTKKTLPSDGTDKLFVGCVLILFSRANSFKPRYDCTRENLLEIVLLAKEKVENINLLDFYNERINDKKGINKYLKEVVKDKNMDKYADLIIEYLNQFKPRFMEEIKSYKEKIEEYLKTNKSI